MPSDRAAMLNRADKSSDLDFLDESDSDDEEEDPKKTDFVSIGGNIVKHVNLKLGISGFIIGLLLFSNVFVEKFLKRVPGAVDGMYPTSKGVVMQLAILIVSVLFIDLLIKGEIL